MEVMKAYVFKEKASEARRYQDNKLTEGLRQVIELKCLIKYIISVLFHSIN